MIGLGDQVASFHPDDFLALSQNDLDLSRILASFVGYCLGKVRRLDLREKEYSSLGFRHDLLRDYRDISLLQRLSLVFDLLYDHFSQLVSFLDVRNSLYRKDGQHAASWLQERMTLASWPP